MGLGHWRATSFLALGFPKEEDAGLAQSKKQKRSKVVLFQIKRRKKRKEKDQNHKGNEDQDSEGSPTSLQSPRMRQKQRQCSWTRSPRRRKHVNVLGSDLNTPTSQTNSCHWSVAWFCQYLCSCCHRRPSLVGENEALDSVGRRAPDEHGRVPGSISRRREKRARLGNLNGRSGQKPGKQRE